MKKLIELLLFAQLVFPAVTHPLSILVVQPSISTADISSLRSLVCLSTATDVEYTIITEKDEVESVYDICDQSKVQTIPVLLNPLHYQHIVSADHARVATLYQDATSLNGIDVVIDRISHSDVVLVGKEIFFASYSFLLYVLQIVPNPPFTIVFAADLISADHMTSDALYHMLAASGIRPIEYKDVIEDGEREAVVSAFRSDVRAKRSYTQSPSYCVVAGSSCIWRRHQRSTKEELCNNEMPLSDRLYISELARAVSLKKVGAIRESVTQSECRDKVKDLFGVDGAGVVQSQQTFPPAESNLTVLCMIYTLSSKSAALESITDSWGRRCDGFLAFSDHTDDSLGAISMDFVYNLFFEEGSNHWTESYDKMWNKAQLIWSTVALSDLIDEYDFFVLGGDDLYVHVDNLKGLLRLKNTTSMTGTPLYLGRLVHANAYVSFHSGGSGYVLNRAAVATLYDLLYPPSGVSSRCLPDIYCSMEDLMVGRCLLEAGITPTSTTHPVDGLETFHPLNPQEEFDASEEWFPRMVDQYSTGDRCCSSYSVSFHHIYTPEMMICLDKLVYI